MTDDAKTRRRETANRIHVKASPVRMSREEFQERFVRQQVVIDLPGVENTCQEMFCGECAKPYGDKGALLVRQLHVTIDDDPLKNFWKLATLKCFGCGFSEIVPLETPNFSSLDIDIVMRNTDVWEDARRKFQEKEKQEYERKRQTQMAQHQQILAQARQQALQGAIHNTTAAEIQQRLEYEKIRMHELQNPMLSGFNDMMLDAQVALAEKAGLPRNLLERLQDKLAKKKS